MNKTSMNEKQKEWAHTYFENVKKDPEKLKEVREYKRQWIADKRAQKKRKESSL